MQIRKLVVLAVLAAAPLSAQGKIGIVVGGVSSNVSVDNDEGDAPKSRTGFAAGLSMAAGGGKISFAPEALYITKGFKFDGGDEDGVGVKLTYIEVPLLFRANLGSSSMKPFVTFGPTVAFKMGCKVTGGDESIDCEDADFLTIKSSDFGGMVGVGVNFGKIGVSARYSMGLSNISDDSENKVKNKALMVMANISF